MWGRAFHRRFVVIPTDLSSDPSACVVGYGTQRGLTAPVFLTEKSCMAFAPVVSNETTTYAHSVGNPSRMRTYVYDLSMK
ncbi:hypothetical protein [Leptospira alexanderi]|uniref:hypothetical protein n=1 Tax=Leptospira alexanderi TaxID=100053 RepID=UPI0009910593|nr:hypothetical protein [Leptospira alexanderi]